MAKSPTEQIRSLERIVDVLQERINHLADGLSEGRDSDRSHDEELRAVRRELAEFRIELAALRQRSDDQQKRLDEWDRRFWAVVLLLAGTVVSSAVALVRK